MSFSAEEKIQQLQKILELDPNDHLGHFMLGKLYLDAERYQEGAREFEQTLALKPDYSAAYRLCGDCYRKAGNVAKAREVYEKGIEVAEGNGDLQTVKEMQVFLRKLSE